MSDGRELCGVRRSGAHRERLRARRRVVARRLGAGRVVVVAHRVVVVVGRPTDVLLHAKLEHHPDHEAGRAGLAEAAAGGAARGVGLALCGAPDLRVRAVEGVVAAGGSYVCWEAQRRTLTAVGTLSAVVKPSFSSLGVDQHSSLPAHATPEQP